jgi:hypothetical protein
MALTKKRRRRRKGAYKKGTHVSTKTGQECRYRSGWELLYMQHLDRDPDVVSYVYEGFKIPYVSNKKTGRIRYYIPDFLIVRTKSRLTLVEVKPFNKLKKPTVVKKMKAAEAWCNAHGVALEYITENELRQLKLL